MARKRASMREGPLAELFKATEAAQHQQRRAGRAAERESRPSRPRPSCRARADAGRPDSSSRARRPAPAPQPAADPSPPAPEPPRPVEPLPEPAPRLHRAPRTDPAPTSPSIRVVGVGGAGLNAVDRMIDAGIAQVEFIAINTDIQQLQMSDAPVKIHIGRELTEGLGSGADPDRRPRAPPRSRYDQVKRALRGSDMVFVTAGEGGGTGSGAAPVVARIARELGALTVGIVTTAVPVRGHAPPRAGRARASPSCASACDTVIAIPNDRLLEVLDRSRRRCSTPSASPTTSSARASRASAT